MIELNNYVQLIIVLSPILTTTATWFLSKRHFNKQNLKLKDNDINDSGLDLIIKKIKIYQDLLDDVEVRCKESMVRKNQKINQLKKDIQEFKDICECPKKQQTTKD